MKITVTCKSSRENIISSEIANQQEVKVAVMQAWKKWRQKKFKQKREKAKEKI